MTKEMIYEKAKQLAPGGKALADLSFDAAGEQKGINKETPTSDRPGVDKGLWNKSFQEHPASAEETPEKQSDRPGVKKDVLNVDETYSYDASKR